MFSVKKDFILTLLGKLLIFHYFKAITLRACKNQSQSDYLRHAAKEGNEKKFFVNISFYGCLVPWLQLVACKAEARAQNVAPRKFRKNIPLCSKLYP